MREAERAGESWTIRVNAKTYGPALSAPLPSFSILHHSAGTSARIGTRYSTATHAHRERGHPHSYAQLVPVWSLARFRLKMPSE